MASVVKILSLLDIRGINNNKLISNRIQELEEIVINKSPIKVERKITLVELIDIREERHPL